MRKIKELLKVSGYWTQKKRNNAGNDLKALIPLQKTAVC